MLRVNQLVGFGKKRPVIGGGGFDSDAQAFFTATGISDSTIQNAIDALVIGLKADGIWTKCVAIYPFVGGTSSTHAVNLKSPGTFDITWSGTVTHNADGVTGNGSDGYGNTGITPSSHLTEDSNHISLYSRTSAEAVTTRDFGCLSDSSANQFQMFLSRGGNFQAFIYAGSSSTLVVANADAQGFYIASRRSNTDFEGYKNGSSVVTNTNADGAARPSQPCYILARNVNDGTPASFSARNYAFCSVGSGLTDTEASNYHSRVETFQDALSRGVV